METNIIEYMFCVCYNSVMVQNQDWINQFKYRPYMINSAILVIFLSNHSSVGEKKTSTLITTNVH